MKVTSILVCLALTSASLFAQSADRAAVQARINYLNDDIKQVRHSMNGKRGDETKDSRATIAADMQEVNRLQLLLK
jgi:hypothetical protein